MRFSALLSGNASSDEILYGAFFNGKLISF
jgi:hypothetical protein